MNGTSEEERAILCVKIKEGCFGIDIGVVREMAGEPKITAIPLLPPFLEGVCGWKGSVLPVLSFENLLRNGVEEHQGGRVMAVVEQGGFRCGLLSDKKPDLILVSGKERLSGEIPDLFDGLLKIDSMYGLEDGVLFVLDLPETLKGVAAIL